VFEEEIADDGGGQLIGRPAAELDLEAAKSLPGFCFCLGALGAISQTVLLTADLDIPSFAGLPEMGACDAHGCFSWCGDMDRDRSNQARKQSYSLR
jgi:hypothetical protein